MGQIPARNNDPAGSYLIYIYDIRSNGSMLLLGDAWENFRTRNDQVTEMPEFARAVVPITIFVGHIIITSFIISRID